MAQRTFRVGVTRDFLKEDGTSGFGDMGLDRLQRAGLEWEYLDEVVSEITPEHAARYDGLLVLAPRVTRKTLAEAVDRRLRVVARFGVGYDTIDVPACTEHGVILTITPDGVRRPMATAAMTLLLSLSLHLRIKDQLTREGRWTERLDYHGQGLTDRTLGIIGFGNIGQDLARLAYPFQLNVMACDPYATESHARSLAVTLVDLDRLLAESDYVCICCSLTPETRHLINAERLAQMKPNAYLINVARGPIVDQRALYDALVAKRIQGAGLDVFEQEPIDPEDPILKLQNVIVSPHCLCWTDEFVRLLSTSAIQSLVDAAHGKLPRFTVNPRAWKTTSSDDV